MTGENREAPQSLAVKRAQVEFHSFASLGDTEVALSVYSRENERRGWLIASYRDFIGPMTPFLEIGANAGHTSYMLANQFASDGFALDLSADALRHGRALQEYWDVPRAPVRVAGDAVHLPFQDGSLAMVMACQMLSQFMDIEQVFLEVKRVLAPGGTFIFTEEPIRRRLSLRLYRCPYHSQMKPWEKFLFRQGLLGYLVKDVIGARQEDSFGIRQNHRMTLNGWDSLITRHFVDRRYEIVPADRGWGEHVVHLAARRMDRLNSDWLPAKLLGGTLTAFCRKAGQLPESLAPVSDVTRFLRCPDCSGRFEQNPSGRLHCPACGYNAALEEGVYNLLASADRAELYPGDRPDTIDFSIESHTAHLLGGWYEQEGSYGGKYRWMGPRASVWLTRVRTGPQRIRIRGHIHPMSFAEERTVRVEIFSNGQRVAQEALDRPGLFVLEADVEDAERYDVEIQIAPAFTAPPDVRPLTANISMIRLIPRD